MSDINEFRTPANKRKQMPGSAKKSYFEITPNKRLKSNLINKNNEEFCEEKVAESSEEISTSDENIPEMLLIAQYDELIRFYEENNENNLLESFLEFAEHQELCRLEWLKSVQECKRLQAELDKANHEIGDFANKLKNARRLLDQEKKLRRRAEEDRNHLENQMLLARDLLFNEKCNRISDDTKEKLAFLNNTSVRSHASFDRNRFSNDGCRLGTIKEVNSHELNSTGSLLSDFSYSCSEDNLDSSGITKMTVLKMKAEEWKKPQQDDSNIVETKTILQESEPITTTNVEIFSPKVDHLVEKLWLKNENSPVVLTATNITRQHTFVSKTVLCPDTCGACKNRIRFGKIVLKCKDCRNICHVECKNDLQLPCIPIMNTPTQKGAMGAIADYVPSTAPMVPALIIHCVTEIEMRGFNEVGLYRVPGSEKEVKTLKEKLLRNKSIPSLSDVDIHVICGVVKDFLRSLREPLVTRNLRKDFIQAVEIQSVKDVVPALYKALGQLPLPNRDTLSYMMLHLNRVAEAKECKMPAGNLAKIFAPTIIGYSSEDIDPQTLLTETGQQFMVMDYLMNIPTDFWASQINVELTTPRNNKLFQTPSVESLPRTNILTPYGSKSSLISRKRKNFFGTPPSKK